MTTVADTIIDLAALPADDLALANRPRAPGAGTLRMVLSGETRVILSRLESLSIAVLRQDRLPLPETNHPAGSKRVDCRWPKHKLTVELDRYRFHNSRHAWEQGHRPAREAYARGDQFRRYTWTDVAEDPSTMLAELLPLLGR